MPESQIEKFNKKYPRKNANTTTHNNTPKVSPSTNLLEEFYQYYKTLQSTTPNIKYNTKRLLELFKTHKDNAHKIYLEEITSNSPNTPTKTSKKWSIIEDISNSQTDNNTNQNTETTQDETTPDTNNQPSSHNNTPDTWINNYEQSLSTWVKKNTFKKTGEPKRTIKTTKDKNSLDVDIEPTQITPHRNDKGVSYHFENSHSNEEAIEITVTNKNTEKPLNYDYIYALAKTAKENGIEIIEFKDIKTPEFANMLMVASLQFGLNMENQPSYQIDENAPYIPNHLKDKIKEYNNGKDEYPFSHQPNNFKKKKISKPIKPQREID